MRYLMILLLAAGCTVHELALNNQFSDFDILRTGDETGTVTEIEQKLENAMLDFGQRVLTPEEQKEVKKAYDEGFQKAKEFLNEGKQVFLQGSTSLHYVVNIPERNHIDNFLAKNPKASGVHPDLILVAATVYRVFDEWMVFEGMRTKEKQAEYVKKGVSWTNNSRHLIGQAYDVLAKNKHGKYDFKEIHRLGMVRGMMDFVHQDLKSKGMVCSEVEPVDKWKRVTDLYHWQINLTSACKKVVKLFKKVIHGKEIYKRATS